MKPKKEKPAPKTCPDVLRCALGFARRQAERFAATLTDEQRSEIVAIAQQPDYGPALHEALDKIADAKNRESGIGDGGSGEDPDTRTPTPEPRIPNPDTP